MKQRPQNVHKRHGCVTSTKHVAFRNSETCISVRLSSKQCHDMLENKTKLNGTKLNTAHAFQCKDHIYFFCAINHIDPLHRQQTLTLSQCNSRDLTDTFTHKSFYTHRRFYTQTLLHADTFTRRCVLHTHTRFHTQTRLHTDALTHRRFYTQTLLHADAFYTRTHAFTHKRFYTQTLLHTDTFT